MKIHVLRLALSAVMWHHKIIWAWCYTDCWSQATYWNVSNILWFIWVILSSESLVNYIIFLKGDFPPSQFHPWDFTLGCILKGRTPRNKETLIFWDWESLNNLLPYCIKSQRPRNGGETNVWEVLRGLGWPIPGTYKCMLYKCNFFPPQKNS